MLVYYYVCAILTLINLVIAIILQRKRANFYVTGFFLLAFLSNLGYLGVALSSNVMEAIAMTKITYLGACFLTMFMIIVICQICYISLSPLIVVGMWTYCAVVFCLALTAGYTDIYYKNAYLTHAAGVSTLVKEYGETHVLINVLLIGFTLFNIIVLINAISKNQSISKKTVISLLAIQIITVGMHFVSRKMRSGLELTPLTYGIVGMILLYVTYKTAVYNVEENIISSFEKQNSYGYILFDDKKNYLGSSVAAREFVPALKNQIIDSMLPAWNTPIFADFYKWIDDYKGGDDIHQIRIDNKDYQCSVQYMIHFSKNRGYIIEISDDTAQQEYIRSLNKISSNRNTFLANISHDIRNPLSNVIGMLEMILRESSEENILGYAEEAAHSGSTMSGLVDQIIDFTRIESGKMELSRSEFELSDVLESLSEMMNNLISEKKLDFLISMGPNVPNVFWGDEARIKQILLNLLTNAVKFTEVGSVELDIYSSLEASAIEKGRMTELTFVVKDTGVGINKKVLSNIFAVNDPSNYTHTQANGGGTGLGLNLAKQFANLMDGDITVESEVGVGTIFTVKIKLQIMDTEIIKRLKFGSKKREAYKESFVAPTAQVLVVDDNKTNLAVVKGLLKKTKVNVTTAQSGYECLDYLRRGRYDIVFLDHMMPELDGMQTLMHIEQEGIRHDVPIIALTANAIDGARSEYLKAGFTDYLSKPIDPKKLEQMMVTYLPENKISVKN